MIFLQPELLWGLPAASLPILIHLLNRLRYRRINWAATAFLVAATRSSTRRARLRHYLVLACRVGALASFLLLLSRPMLGGRVSAWLAGAPEVVLIAWDRSPSMDALVAGVGQSRREVAMELLATAERQIGRRGVRYLWLDSATMSITPLQTLQALRSVKVAGPAAAGASIPAMLRAAARRLADERPGRAELWIVSDLQAASWTAPTEVWSSAVAGLKGLPMDLTVRVLAMDGPAPENRAVRIQSVRRVGDRPARLELAVEIESEGGADPAAAIPVTWNWMGARTAVDVSIEGPLTIVRRAWEWPENADAVWGGVELPADGNVADNTAWFAVGLPQHARVGIVAQDSTVERRVQLAFAPRPTSRLELLRTRPMEVTPSWIRSLALLVWQAPAPTGAIAMAIGERVAQGGVVVWLPPGVEELDVGGTDGPGWTKLEAAEHEPWRVSSWLETEGPLARTLDGRNLPLERLEIRRRARWGHRPGYPWTVLAQLSDGVAWMARRTVGTGSEYIVGTLPIAEWSNLGEEWVWVPILQRILDEAVRPQGLGRSVVAGQWKAEEGEVWQSVAGNFSAEGDQAGVGRCGERWVAVNRPRDEDDRRTWGPEEVRRRLSPLRVTIAHVAWGPDPSVAERSEIWPLLALLAMVFLLVESALLGSEFAPQAVGVSARRST